jgi:hypothetical protein
MPALDTWPIRTPFWPQAPDTLHHVWSQWLSNLVTAANTVDLSTSTIVGTLPDGNLSSNVPLKDGNNAFTGTNTFAPPLGKSSLPATIAYEDEANVFAQNQLIAKPLTELQLLAAGTGKGRVVAFQESDARLTANQSWNGTGWDLDNTSQGGGQIAVHAGGLLYASSAAGVNPRPQAVVFTVTAGGNTTIAGSLAVTGLLTDASLSSNVPLKNTGNVFTAAQELASVSPILNFNETDQGADLKRWRVVVDSQLWQLQTTNDAQSTAANVLTFTRAGLLSIPGGQIAFPATPNPSSNVNTLDDYKEGVWTATDVSGAGLGTLGTGTYVKIGITVWVSAQVIYPATASGLAAAIGGLPYAVNAGVHGGGASVYGVGRLWFFTAGTSTVSPLNFTTGAALTNANLTSSNNIFQGFYRV